MKGFALGVMVSVFALAPVAIAASSSIKDEMKSVLDPASTVLFAVAGEVDPSNGPQPSPTTEARWREASAAAAKIKSVALALMAPDQIRPGDEWSKDAKHLGDLADAAQSAADTKNGSKLADAANGLGDTCGACHAKYKTQS